MENKIKSDLEYVKAKHIVIKTKSSEWFGSDYNMNIYRGCCHGCIYCDSRSDCYGITDFDRVKPKLDALAIIRDDLRRKVKKGVVMTGAMSDPYNPLEKELRLTGRALELINAFEFGVGIATKSALIARDIDVLRDIEEHSPVIAKITVTTSDNAVSKLIEPNVSSPEERFGAIAKLSENGLFAGVLLMPVLPFINDGEGNIRNIVKMANEAGAKFIYPAFGVTLRDSQREYFFKRLDELFPGTKEKYIKKYKNDYKCTSPHARKLWNAFSAECEKYGILFSMKAIIQTYKHSHKGRQLTLWDY